MADKAAIVTGARERPSSTEIVRDAESAALDVDCGRLAQP